MNAVHGLNLGFLILRVSGKNRRGEPKIAQFQDNRIVIAR